MGMTAVEGDLPGGVGREAVSLFSNMTKPLREILVYKWTVLICHPLGQTAAGEMARDIAISTVFLSAADTLLRK
jgi:hypothetical protein